ncbi:AAA family ATPase [Prescottella equi]|uniref:AAA family ATPase n=1 Tax=Rhodococcus hoagii TaxID=43767 RepID=UPI0019D8F9F8|nr:AAA family ATPase [Prescottella equi]NKT12470.1 AAA family ATPase [Prescottella equi]NKW49508.1 AAA family ATPase [Prescottella equi]UNQ41711.1 AAA family ATPase [Prescottella equi]
MTTDPFGVPDDELAADSIPSRAATPEDDVPAKYVRGDYVAAMSGWDPDAELSEVPDPDTIKAVRGFCRQYDLDPPETLRDCAWLPVGIVEDILDTVPTRQEVAEDAANHGEDDPHDVAARLIAEHVARRRERAREREGRKAAEKQLREHAASIHPDALFTAAILEQYARGEPAAAEWAQRAVEQMSHENNMARLPGPGRDRKTPRLGYTAIELVRLFGVPPEQVAALPPATQSDLAEAVRRFGTERRAEQNAEQRAAKLIEAEQAAAGIELPERINLAEFVPPDDPWLIDGLMRRETNLGLFAQFKAGKTTAVREIVRSLLDGDKVFGRFPVNVPPGTEVVLIDSEMPLDNLKEEYEKAGTLGFDRLDVRSIKGRERSFDVRVPSVQQRWASLISPGSVIVFDCLYSVLAALGISENDDTVAEVLLGLRALATECQALGTIMVHHLGKDSERGARGHSSIEGWPDVLCRIHLDGPLGSGTPHVFSAYGRGVEVEPGVLVLGDDHRLTLESRADKKAAAKSHAHDADDAAVLDALRAQPGLSGSALRDAAGVPTKRAYAACKRLEERGVVENRGSGTRPEWHAAGSETRAGDPFSSVADLVTDTARTDVR